MNGKGPKLKVAETERGRISFSLNRKGAETERGIIHSKTYGAKCDLFHEIFSARFG
jgi:hypothetical protein